VRFVNQRLMSIYLNDHLTGSTIAGELVRRAARNNRGNEYGAVLTELSREIAEDRATLLALMRELGAAVDRAKVIAGWVAEKAGRLKLNGSLMSYSPLSRVIELEALMLGVAGKRSLWIALDTLSSGTPALAAADLPNLIARADSQLARLEEQRRRAAVEALAD
jgi:hypothetical protein